MFPYYHANVEVPSLWQWLCRQQWSTEEAKPRLFLGSPIPKHERKQCGCSEETSHTANRWCSLVPASSVLRHMQRSSCPSASISWQRLCCCVGAGGAGGSAGLCPWCLSRQPLLGQMQHTKGSARLNAVWCPATTGTSSSEPAGMNRPHRWKLGMGKHFQGPAWILHDYIIFYFLNQQGYRLSDHRLTLAWQPVPPELYYKYINVPLLLTDSDIFQSGCKMFNSYSMSKHIWRCPTCILLYQNALEFWMNSSEISGHNICTATDTWPQQHFFSFAYKSTSWQCLPPLQNVLMFKKRANL